ncbi:hypothetical protein ACFX5E_00930 [Flavobacterium sp. LS2P90]|uniref:Uncharacterized protein n=1 Tax=Flavobacterium xylosi TaxID=3230415 RepID=A0ABW6HRK7_9FLAO
MAQFAFNKNLERVNLEAKYPRIAELPFDSNRKTMTTLHQFENGILVITKGAVDVLLHKLANN